MLGYVEPITIANSCLCFNMSIIHFNEDYSLQVLVSLTKKHSLITIKMSKYIILAEFISELNMFIIQHLKRKLGHYLCVVANDLCPRDAYSHATASALSLEGLLIV